MSLAVFRIAQEALTNAIRHARASRIDVRLEGRSELLLLQVIDDGRGIAQADLGQGFGTRGIQERVRALGGQASWTGDEGTHLTVTLPLARSV
ncbi:MAG: ATP-binding protein [Nannocystaceae bacterium]